MKRSLSFWKQFDPRTRRAPRVLLLVTLLAAGVVSPVFAQSGTGIPIIDGILDFIDQYKLAIAMLGVAVVALGLLVKPVFPDLWNSHRSSIVYMVLGGILLTMIPTVAALIVGG